MGKIVIISESEIIQYIVNTFMGIECSPGFLDWLKLLEKNSMEIQNDIKSHLPSFLINAKTALTKKEKIFPLYEEKDFDRLVKLIVSALHSHFFSSPKREEKKELSEEYVPEGRFLLEKV